MTDSIISYLGKRKRSCAECQGETKVRDSWQMVVRANKRGVTGLLNNSEGYLRSFGDLC